MHELFAGTQLKRVFVSVRLLAYHMLFNVCLTLFKDLGVHSTCVLDGRAVLVFCGYLLHLLSYDKAYLNLS